MDDSRVVLYCKTKPIKPQNQHSKDCLRMNQSKTIYADYQATTPLDPQVLERMLPFWKDSFGNPHSSDHIVGWNAAEAVRQSQTSVASLIGADQDEIIFTSGATEANNLALLGIARNAPPNRRRILVSAIEHKCVLASARTLQDREGFTVEVIPVDEYGLVNIAALKEMLDESVLVASVMAVNNEIGTIQDVPTIAATLAEWGILFHCDAAQAPCAMDLSGIAQHADLISLSAHKFYGPQGIGALFVRRYLQSDLEPVIYGGGQQQGLRSGTLPVALCAGMAAAAGLIMENGADERKRIGALRDRFTALLQDGGAEVRINGPVGDCRHPGNANLRFDSCSAHDILGALQPDLAASTGAACTSGLPEPSHVLRAIGLTADEAESSIRFSFGRFTRDEDISKAAALTLHALDELPQQQDFL